MQCLNSYKNPMRLILSLFHIWENWGWERSSHTCKWQVTQLASGWAGIWASVVSLFWLQRLSSFHLNLAPCGHCRLWKCSPVSTSWRVEPGKGRMAYHFLKGRFCSIMRAGPMEMGRVRRILQLIKPVEMKVWNWGWRGGNKELEGDPWDLEWGEGGEEAGGSAPCGGR